MVKQKKVGWGACIIADSALGSYEDIMMDSAKLSHEEGQEKEAPIEGGEAEARDKDIDKYTLVAQRRIDDETEVEDVIGFTPTIDSVKLHPKNGGVGVTLLNPSRHVAVQMDSKDGLVAIYTYKTKGANDGKGHPTDIQIGKQAAPVFTAVDPESEGYSTKNPKTENWYIKNGADYIRSYDTEVQEGMTYYERS